MTPRLAQHGEAGALPDWDRASTSLPPGLGSTPEADRCSFLR